MIPVNCGEGRQYNIRNSACPSTESSAPNSSDSCDENSQINKLCANLENFNFRTINHFDTAGNLVREVETCVRSVATTMDIDIHESRHRPHKPLPPRDDIKHHKPWMTNDTLRLIRIRDMLKASLGHQASNDKLEHIQYEMYKKARNSVVTLCRNNRADYFENHPEAKISWEKERKQWEQDRNNARQKQ